MEGRAHRSGNATVLRFVRPVAEPRDRVWRRLVEPSAVAEWLGPAALEPVVGGRVVLDLGDRGGGPVEGRVRRLQRGALLEHSWSDPSCDAAAGWIRWRLHPAGRGTFLSLSHRPPVVADVPLALACWHLRLDLLAASLELGDTVWLPARLERLRRHYMERVGMATVTDPLQRAWSGPAPSGERATATGWLQERLG
ncbi:MAG: SRPBCC domain-containing protein [Acidimicrobiales bacterium]